MTALAEILKRHGPLGLALLILASLCFWLMRELHTQGERAADERAYNAQILMDALADTQNACEAKR